MKKLHMQRKINKVDMIPMISCLIVFVYMFYILINNMVVGMLPHGDWMDGTKAICSLAVLFVFHIAVQYKVSYVIKKYSYFIYGFLFAMAFINSNLGTALLTLAVVFLFFSLNPGKGVWKGFLATALVLEGLQIYLIYNGLNSMKLNQTFCLSGWFVLWIAIGIVVCAKKSWIGLKLRGNTSGNVYKVCFVIFAALFGLCFVLGVIHQYFHEIPVIGPYLNFSYNGQSVVDFLLSLGIKRKIAGFMLVCFLYGLNVFCYIRVGKGTNLSGNVMLFVLQLYSIAFADIFVPVCIFLWHMALLVHMKWSFKGKLLIPKKITKVFPFVVGIILFMISFIVTPIVNWDMNRKHPRIEISMEQLRACEGTLVGFDVLSDGGLRSNCIDPWIVLFYGQFGLYDIQNVNVKINYCKKDVMYIFGIGQYGRDAMNIRIGDNYMDLDFIAPGDFGVRIDLTSTNDRYFLLDKIVFNDYSYVGTAISKELRSFALFLWLFGLLEKIFSCFNAGKVKG